MLRPTGRTLGIRSPTDTRAVSTGDLTVTASTISQFSAFVKQYFNPQEVDNLTKCNRPLWGRVNKNEDISGDPWIVPVLYVNGQGLAAISHAKAQTNATNTKGARWSIDVANYFASVSIGDKVMMATRNNAGAFLDNKTTEIEALYGSVGDAFATYCYRNGGGAIGTIQAIAGNVITLTNRTDAFFFEFGMVIAACSDDGTNTSTTPRVGTSDVTVVDRTNGQITLTAVPGTFAVGDSLFRDGDVVANTGTLLMHGVSAFITSTDSPATLWGQARTSDPQRLAGCRVPANQLPGKGIEERIQLLGSLMAGTYRAMTASGDWEIYLHPEDMQTLNISLQAKGIRELTDDSTQFGYTYVEVYAGGMKMKIFADPFCQKGTLWMLYMKSWTLGSYGPPIKRVNGDGLELLRSATTNDYELRLTGYPEIVCNAPGRNGFVPVV
jgi:hypothetical protein